MDSLLCAGRDREAAQAFFEHAAGRSEAAWPDRVNVDGYAATHLALRMLGKKDQRWRSVDVRSNRYLNNVVEQDHRAIKGAVRLDARTEVLPNGSHHSRWH